MFSGMGQDGMIDAGSVEARSRRSEAEGSFPFAGSLMRLGGCVALDGRVSWAPRLPGHYQPVSCYVARQGERPVLVDTGIALHRDAVLRQLDAVIPPGRPLTTFLTRTELECTGNLGALHAAGRIARIVNAGAIGPFDAFDDALEGSVPMSLIPLGTGSFAAVDEAETLYVIPAFIRMLSTMWVFDATSRTLFSTDFFGHTSVASPRDPAVIGSLTEDRTSRESARAHLLAKFWWLPRARTSAMRNWLAGIFDRFDVEIIAPTHGCILSGRPVVRRHLELMLRLLREMEEDR
ncbi:hypothetical protein [Roseomonas chloroacetimidivorans]|uniref:hypothetical protein n=1 Tax=Roseomonas chloroacetimidivorans TaxID=1766656 RepID=UPI003C74539C